MRLLATWVLLGTGCAALGLGAETDTDPPPPPITARFVADAYLQDCRWSGDDWLGVEALRVTLHHRLDEVPELALPAPGTCTAGMELFAEEALLGGDPIPDFDERPRYTSPQASGSLTSLTPGLWHTDAFVSPERCGTLEESVGDGAVLEQAGPFTDLATPPTASWPTARADGQRFSDHDTVQVGDTVELTWQADGWTAAFVQIRREHEGEVREVITCGAEGGSFTLDETAWGQANQALLADDARIYLGLIREELVETVDGSARAWMVLRAIHVLKP